MKQKRYWLWVGLASAIISVPIYLLNGTDNNLSNVIDGFYFPTTLYILSGPGMILGERPVTEQVIAVLLNGFLYGATIGWLYAKIKSRRQVGTILK
jgi:hypothetical protein